LGLAPLYKLPLEPKDTMVSIVVDAQLGGIFLNFSTNYIFSIRRQNQGMRK